MNNYSKNNCTKDLIVVKKFETLKYIQLAIIIIGSICLLISNFMNNKFSSIITLQIPFIILAILGFTHIRKDFGEKSGILFSSLILFLTFLVQIFCKENFNIWPIIFMVITLIYSHRIYKSGISSKNWIIFSIFSFLTGISNKVLFIVTTLINILLFMYFLINNIKQRNYVVKYIKYSKNLKKSTISISIQIIGYIIFYIVLF